MARKATEAPAFDEFWALYPVHKDRKRAEQAWQRLSAGDRRAALAALPAYIADCQRNGIDKFKYAQGWLNGRRWEDELEQGNAPTPFPADGRLPLQGRGAPSGTFEHPRQTGSGVSRGASGTKPEHSAPQGPETNGTPPLPPVGMEKW